MKWDDVFLGTVYASVEQQNKENQSKMENKEKEEKVLRLPPGKANFATII